MSDAAHVRMDGGRRGGAPCSAYGVRCTFPSSILNLNLTPSARTRLSRLLRLLVSFDLSRWTLGVWHLLPPDDVEDSEDVQ